MKLHKHRLTLTFDVEEQAAAIPWTLIEIFNKINTILCVSYKKVCR